MGTWYVYVLRSADERRTYVGVTKDLARRLAQHNGEVPGGAKSTRGGRPWAIAGYYGPYETRGLAQRQEHAIKSLSGGARLCAVGVETDVKTVTKET